MTNDVEIQERRRLKHTEVEFCGFLSSLKSIFLTAKNLYDRLKNKKRNVLRGNILANRMWYILFA